MNDIITTIAFAQKFVIITSRRRRQCCTTIARWPEPLFVIERVGITLTQYISTVAK